MKTQILCALCAMILCLTGAGEPTLQSAARTDEMVRLHVVADSDDPEAQALKLEARDAVLAKARAILEDCPDADTAYDRLSSHLGELEDAARTRVRALGYDGEVTAAMGTFDFPEREYGGVTVPAGAYRALRVTLGSGQGANWWCVLYPTLCFSGEGTHPSLIAKWIQGLWGGEEA